MPKWRGLTWVVVSVLVLAAMLAGCGGGRQVTPSSESPPRPGIEDAIEAMKRLPLESGVMSYFNIAALREDRDLSDAYERFRGSNTAKTLSAMGMRLTEIDYLVMAGGTEGYGILRGGFALDRIQNSLQGADYEQGTYLDVEIWMNPKANMEAIALLADSIVIATYVEQAKRCIRTITGQASSMYDNQDFRDVIDRLPGGIWIVVGDGGSLDPVTSGALAEGLSVKKVDSQSLRAKYVQKWEEDDAAQRALPNVKNIFGEGEFSDIEVLQKGQFVEGTGKADIKALDWSF